MSLLEMIINQNIDRYTCSHGVFQNLSGYRVRVLLSQHYDFCCCLHVQYIMSSYGIGYKYIHIVANSVKMGVRMIRMAHLSLASVNIFVKLIGHTDIVILNFNSVVNSCITNLTNRLISERVQLRNLF